MKAFDLIPVVETVLPDRPKTEVHDTVQFNGRSEDLNNL